MWEDHAMKHHFFPGAAGVQLHVLEAGNPRGRPILLIHGFSQCSLAWSCQLASDLAHDFRLLAPDLRGHGLSDKPHDAYADSRLWADDLHATLHALHVEQPIVCCWSYAFPLLDYLRHYGDEAIAGIHLVGAITRLGTPEAFSVITPHALGIVPALFGTDAAASVRDLQAFIRMLSSRPVSTEELYLMLGYNSVVPPEVRKALFSRSVDNDDVLATIRKPVLISHGADDAVVTCAAAERHKALMPHAEVDIMPGAGHAPFRDDPEAFNRRLRTFSEKCRRTGAALAQPGATVSP
jgi:non-heme chloroperoxidase